MGELEGRRALVTGGASGIGLATVRRLAAEGAKVAVVDRNEDGARQAAEEVGGVAFGCDVSDSAQVADVFAKGEAELGGLDIAYLNAGITTAEGDIARLTDEQYLKILGVNVNHVVFGCREAVKLMEPRGGGTIVATASLAGIVAYSQDPIYALTKHAVVGLVRGLGPQLEPRGIRIKAICPGIVETPLVGAEATKVLKDAGFPMLRPEDIAEAVMRAIVSPGTGECWACQPGREPLVYEFRGVPGPRVAGKEGMAPPGFR